MGEGKQERGEKRNEKLLGCVFVSALEEQEEEEEDHHHGRAFVCGRVERVVRD